MSQKRDDVTRCRYCGEKLSLLQRLSRADYCNAQHRDAYQRDQEKLALGRLQQVVTEGREAELAGQLRKGASKLEAPAEDNWPEEPQQQTQPGRRIEAAPAPAASIPAKTESQRVTAPPSPPAPTRRPVRGVEYEETGGDAASGQRLCGPICSSDVAALGRITPALQMHEPEDLGSGMQRMPESATELRTPRIQSVEGRQLGIHVPSNEGERRGRESATRSEIPLHSGMRFPALSIQSVAWTDAVERERLSWAGIPPLAGLIQIAGPQTLRFEARLRKPMPLPEHPAGNPVRAYQPGLARGGGVPSMAGAIRGLGTWRTRFGSEGNLRPQWESDLLEMTVTADWQPRYPAFYTTSPWAGEGFEQIFGLGAGHGPGEGGDGIDTSTPEGMMTLLENLGPGPGGGLGPGQGGAPSLSRSVGGTDSGAAAGSETAQASRVGSFGGAMSGRGTGTGPDVDLNLGAAELAPAAQTAAAGRAAGPGLGAGAGPGLGSGSGSAGGSSIADGTFLSRLGPDPSSAGRGKGPGIFNGKASGNGVGDGAGSGSGDGRGVVSIEAVAALVKAARQSDRSRTPLRDIEIGLLNHAAEPRLAEPLAWRGLTEGCARGLAGRGPIWIKAPFELPASAGAQGSCQVNAEHLPAAIPRAPLRPLELAAPVLPVLEIAPEQDWNQTWLQPIPGAGERLPVEAGHLEVQSKALVPEHRILASPTGGAGQLQPTVRLPEPWIEPALFAAQLSGRLVEALPVLPAEPRIPVRPNLVGSQGDRRLELGGLESPGTRWVLLRGSEEAATFRLSLDHLRAQEPGTPRAAEWGPVSAPRPAAATRAGLAPSRGFVHHDLNLQWKAAEPWLEPVMCQFGSARGGVWG